ncbi:MAG: hypothetical protein RL410_828 [Actinomycetota bacterium]|jgi:hypothetical protein
MERIMNRIDDDDVLNEYPEVVSRLDSEFSALEFSARKIQKRSVARRLAIAAAVAAVAIAAPVIGRHDEVANSVWAAVPQKLSNAELGDIRTQCLESAPPSQYQMIVTDYRGAGGLMLLTTSLTDDQAEKMQVLGGLDDGKEITLNQVAVLCRFEHTEKGFTAPEINMNATAAIGESRMWGKTEFGKLKVWQLAAELPIGATVAKITDSAGLTFDASVSQGFALAWWPQHEGEHDNGGEIKYYDATGKLLETASLDTTDPAIKS